MIFTKYKKITFSIIGFLLLILIWFVIAEIIGEKVLVFPGPIETFNYLRNLLITKSTYFSILNSLWKMLVGYLISIILALFFGTIAGLFNNFYLIFKPFITTLKTIPTACLLFLFIVMIGFANAPIFVVILVAFPILYEAVVGGITNIPKNINDAISLDGGNNLLNVIKIKIPLAFNYILVGIASSFALAFKVEIMSEVLSGATIYGIGTSLKYVQANDVNMAGILAWGTIAILILLVIELLSNLIKKKLIKNN